MRLLDGRRLSNDHREDALHFIYRFNFTLKYLRWAISAFSGKLGKNEVAHVCPCGWGFEQPIIFPRFSNIWTHLYCFRPVETSIQASITGIRVVKWSRKKLCRMNHTVWYDSYHNFWKWVFFRIFQNFSKLGQSWTNIVFSHRFQNFDNRNFTNSKFSQFYFRTLTGIISSFVIFAMVLFVLGWKQITLHSPVTGSSRNRSHSSGYK